MSVSQSGANVALRTQKTRLVQLIIRKRAGLAWRLDSSFMRTYARLMGIPLGRGVRFAGRAILSQERPGSLRIGDRVVIVSRSWATALGVSRPVILRCLTQQAFIEIGDDCGLSGTVICAAKSVSVGKRCLLGADVTIFDTDFHPHEYENRRYAAPDWEQISAPVTIEDDVFIGTGAVIQKGVTIGRGSIVAAHSIVTRSVPPMSVVGGNPAKLLRRLDQ